MRTVNILRAKKVSKSANQNRSRKAHEDIGESGSNEKVREHTVKNMPRIKVKNGRNDVDSYEFEMSKKVARRISVEELTESSSDTSEDRREGSGEVDRCGGSVRRSEKSIDGLNGMRLVLLSRSVSRSRRTQKLQREDVSVSPYE